MAKSKNQVEYLDPRFPAFTYVVLGGAALSVLLLTQLQRGQHWVVSLLILAVGAAGLLIPLRLAPTLVFGLVVFNELFRQLVLDERVELELAGPLPVGDVLQCAALLGYVASQYRLQALARTIFPRDEPLDDAMRLHGTASLRKPMAAGRRPCLMVTRGELALLVVALPFWALAAQLLWSWLARPRDLLEWDWRAVRAVVCLVVLISSMIVVAAFLHHLRQRRMTLEEATLLLQDTLSIETRGELRWHARWLTWFRRRKKEQT